MWVAADNSITGFPYGPTSASWPTAPAQASGFASPFIGSVVGPVPPGIPQYVKKFGIRLFCGKSPAEGVLETMFLSGMKGVLAGGVVGFAGGEIAGGLLGIPGAITGATIGGIVGAGGGALWGSLAVAICSGAGAYN